MPKSRLRSVENLYTTIVQLDRTLASYACNADSSSAGGTNFGRVAQLVELRKKFGFLEVALKLQDNIQTRVRGSSPRSPTSLRGTTSREVILIWNICRNSNFPAIFDF